MGRLDKPRRRWLVLLLTASLLGATLLGAPFPSAAGADDGTGTDTAPEACDTADAISKALAAFQWHTSHGTNAAMFWRILNTLDADNLPAKPADVADNTITAADAAAFSNGNTWGGWTPINAALTCTEKAAQAETDEGTDSDNDDGTGDDGSDTDDGTDDDDDNGSGASDQDSQDSGQGTQQQQSSQDQQPQQQQSQQDSQDQQDSVDTQQSQQDQASACTDWDSSDITIGEDDLLMVKLSNTPAGCGDFDSTVTLEIDVVASHNGTKPYRDGCTSTPDIWGDNVSLLGIMINTKNGWLQASPCDDNTIVERQVIIRDTNPAGGAATKTITITDDDSYHLMAPDSVWVQRQSRLQNLPADADQGYDATKTYASGEKVVDGLYTWTRNSNPLKHSGSQPAPGSEHKPGVFVTRPQDTRGCRTSTSHSDSQYCWTRSRNDSAGVSVEGGRAYYAPYRLVFLLSGAAHPTGSSSFAPDGTEITYNVPADDGGFTGRYAWYTQNITCPRSGPGWVQVHVYQQNGPKFDTTVMYQHGGNKIQVCW